MCVSEAEVYSLYDGVWWSVCGDAGVECMGAAYAPVLDRDMQPSSGQAAPTLLDPCHSGRERASMTAVRPAIS